MKTIDASTLLAQLQDGAEICLLDAREDGEFGASHPFWDVPCGLAKLELRAPAILPRKTVRVCCMDDGRGLAERMAAWLESRGYSDVSVLGGGTRAWEAVGNVLFSGFNVPSKAFGEWAEHHYGTESVDAPELKAWIESGRDMVVLDSRTLEEFTRMSIPTGVSVPGGELAYRIADMVPNPDTLVVVNCAGRTRSIMGAESLRRAGVPNRVVALRNGTMGWELAGLECDRGKTARFPAGTPKTLDTALARAKKFAEDSGVRTIDAATFHGFERDASRTLYVLDVRDPDEFAAGHRAGSANAPGGQLVQATDTWVGVLGARIALVDDTGARARMSAAWLRLMGHKDVFVVEGGLAAIGPGTPAAKPALPEPASIDAAGLAAILGTGAVVVDLARSVDFRAGHIPGAIWGVRTRLGELATKLAGAKAVVLASPDGVLAKLAHAELAALTGADTRVLAGGTAAWRAAGRPMAADKADPPDEGCIDFYLRPYDRNTGVEEAMNAYLTWEIDLANEIRRDPTIHFGPTGSGVGAH